MRLRACLAGCAALAACAVLSSCAGPAGPAPGAVAPAAAAAPDAARPPGLPALRNAGFEDPMPADARCAPRWDCSAHGNPEAFRFVPLTQGAATGAASVCIERVLDEPWALITQGFHTTALRGKRVRLSMAVRADGLEGPGAGPWILSQGGHAHAQKLVKATRGWERVAVELTVPADSTVIQAGATLEGPGKACFDDVTLEQVDGPVR